MIDHPPHPASFRDPSGFVYERDGEIYRQVSEEFAPHYDFMWSSGLFEEFMEEGLLVPSERVDLSFAASADAYAVLRTGRLPFISYPYEWAFGALKEAALLTLELARRAIGHGMILKDASAYNVQFVGSKATFIDTLSFEIYQEGEPWVAYGQFCRHFLAPLALMAHTDIRLQSLLRIYIDGIPLDLAANLLPGATRLKPGLAAHLHMHAKASNQTAKESVKTAKMSKTGLLALVDSLKGTIDGLKWEPKGTEWGDYYQDTNYSEEAMEHKRRLVTQMLQDLEGTCWDLGANTGEFSRIAVEQGLRTISLDVDPAAVEKAYRAKVSGILPLLQDFSNPSAAIGWECLERDSLIDRGPADVLLALALIHHLAIGNNVPLERVAEFFAMLGERVIVEFVPKEDSQVRRLLASRRDVFSQYHETGFETAFSRYFHLEGKVEIVGTHRTLYRWIRRFD